MRSEPFEVGGVRPVTGVRCWPREPTGVAALVLAGSSGRVDEGRARALAGAGAVAEAVRWFGGPGQSSGPYDVPLELFFDRVAALRAEADRVVLVGTSFGAEAALLAGALAAEAGVRVEAVAAFAPSDVVWAGLRPDGTVTSHWTLEGRPVPSVPFDDRWRAESEPPAYVGLYRASRTRFAARLDAATIPVERIGEVVLVAGGDDLVWPSAAMAAAVAARREAHGLAARTVVVTDPEAGHRTVLPGETAVAAGVRMQRGSHEAADQRLGSRAWPHLCAVLAGPTPQ